jgi:hypothetical protein
MTARRPVPQLGGLARWRALVVGSGQSGGQIAEELARALFAT